MKKLFTLAIVFLFGIGFSNAEKTEGDRRYNNYTKNFIFIQDGIEFAVFPDGQFDFNYLQDRNGVDVYVNTGNVQVSFNTGYDYNRWVQYDTYGAVIQIEEIPVFYDPYGRVSQIGNVNIFYNNGFVNRIGSLNVYYSSPGIINYHTGYINTFNRNYIYQPWHTYYSVPFANRCIVYTNPYRTSYYPIRYAYSYHVNYWNTPNYYNGCFARANVRRNFYRPYDRVNYRSFERGRRDSNGRAVAINSRTQRNRQAIATGRSQVTRNDRSRSVASTDRTSGRNTTANSTRSNTSRSGRSAETVNTRSNRNTAATSTNTTRSSTASLGNRNTDRTASIRATRSNGSVSATNNNRVTQTSRVAPTRSTRATSTRSNATRATITGPTRNASRATTSRNTSSRNTQARAARSNSSRNTQARRASSTGIKNTARQTTSSRSTNRRG